LKVVILAGGLGTRFSEETDVKPKPMVEIGGKPILWHIMKIYSRYGFNDFVVCLGYKGYVIKEYFHHYFLHQSDVAIDLANNSMEYLSPRVEPWKITMVDTGVNTLTGGRIKRVQQLVGDEPFMATYGDGVSDVDIAALVAFHKQHGGLGTVTAVQPAGRYGSLEIDETARVSSFVEKPRGDNAWINGGFFVFDPGFFDFIEGDKTSLEREPLEALAREGQLGAYLHHGFWQPMDTLRDKNVLEELWSRGRAPWKVW
jgi:glucose-1-phosphate cytidylyltransferase